jgi:diguanylate cyclase (GGDEF)-like protein
MRENSGSWPGTVPPTVVGVARPSPTGEVRRALAGASEALRDRLWLQLGLVASTALVVPAGWLLVSQPGVGAGGATVAGLAVAWLLARAFALRLARRLAHADDLKKALTDSERLRGELQRAIAEKGLQADRLRVALDESERLRQELESAMDNREDEIRDRTEELQIANLNLERLAREDALTGIANHRRFVEFADQCWRIGIREQKPVAMLMVDVDFFKAYNDIYGHQAGDQCLRRVARELQNLARRPLDLAARYGGEEFAVILYGTQIEDAIDLAELARRAIERLKIPHSGSNEWGVVTLSVGVAAVLPQADTDATLLINLADKALYRAKRNGRNCFQR